MGTQLSTNCPVCEGRRPDCPHCDGTNRIDRQRCPYSFLEPVHLDVCRAASLVEAGFLPAAGGWAEQSATFLDAVSVVLREKASHEAARRRREANALRR